MVVILMLLFVACLVYVIVGILFSIYNAVDTNRIIKRRKAYMEYYKGEHPEYVEFLEKIRKK